MKKFLTLTIIALVALIAMSTNVQAAEVSTWEAVKSELASGTDNTVTFTGTATITDTQTLDLNGKTLILKNSLVVNGGSLTITGNGTISTEVASDLITVKKGSTVVVENGTLKNTTCDNAVFRVEGSATDTTEKTTVTIKKDAKLIGNYGLYIPSVGGYGVVINMYGTFEGITGNNGYNEGTIGISVNGQLQSKTGNIPVINIYEGAVLKTVEGTLDTADDAYDMNQNDAPVIYAAGYAKWNISGGYLEGSEALSIKGGEFYITGGELKGNGKFNPNPNAYGDGSEATGSAISITENKKYAGNIILEVSNAKVTSKNGYAVFETITDAALQPAVNNLKINSGEFVGAAGAVKAETQSNFIVGGTFSSEVEKEYLSNNVQTGEAEDGTILAGTKHSVKVEDTIKENVKPSLTEAIKGQTVTLTVTPEKGYQLVEGSLKAYDSKGNEVAVVNGKFVMPDDEVTVEAKFEKIPETTGGAEGEKEEEKDTTPDTGVLNLTSYAWIVLVAIVMTVALKNKKVAKHSK